MSAMTTLAPVRANATAVLSSPTKSTITTSRSPARVNLMATKGNAGTSETATLTATGLVPRKSTARSSEASVTTAVVSLDSVTALDSTPGPPEAHSDPPDRSWAPSVDGRSCRVSAPAKSPSRWINLLERAGLLAEKESERWRRWGWGSWAQPWRVTSQRPAADSWFTTAPRPRRNRLRNTGHWSPIRSGGGRGTEPSKVAARLETFHPLLWIFMQYRQK